MLYFTSDSHFGHDRLRTLYCPERGKKWPSIEKHDNGLIELWNNKVSKDDKVYVLGDFAFATIQRIANILKKLNGEKHLILGNHDKYTWSEYCNAGFTTVQRFQIIYIKGYGTIGLAHDPSSCIVDRTIPWFTGHLHQQFVRFGNAINVGVDVRNFAPVSIEELSEDLRITLGCNMKMDLYAEKEILGKE